MQYDLFKKGPTNVFLYHLSNLCSGFTTSMMELQKDRPIQLKSLSIDDHILFE